jgi:hypothetical protein
MTQQYSRPLVPEDLPRYGAGETLWSSDNEAVMTEPDSDIAAIVDVSDEKLLRRALIDAAEALGRYAIAGNSAHGAIKFLETMRQQLDEARQHVQTVRAQRRSLQA